MLAFILVALHSSLAWTAPTSPPVMSSGQLQACASSMNGALPSLTPSDFHFSGNVRRYYVAAEEVEWNYAPTGWDNVLGIPFDLSPRAKTAGYVKYGTTWLKALYRGYTDSSFSEYSPQPPWQGTQGPTLRSEVGDLLEIMFVNKLKANYATMHSMGLMYAKPSEGSDYPNVTAGVNDHLPETEAVPPGGCVVYKWLADEAAGPSKDELARTHSYHSFVSYRQDSNAGLLGPQIVYGAGKMESTMANYREFPLLYMVYNETDSWLSGENAVRLDGKQSSGQRQPPQSLWPGNQTVWSPQLTNLGGSGGFQGAPRFHALNGYVYANSPTFEMCLDDKVIWYVNAFGSASHVFHMHGNGYTYQGYSGDAISINDGVGKTLYMTATGEGQWQVLCHVANHEARGMEDNYRVFPAGQCPLQSNSTA